MRAFDKEHANLLASCSKSASITPTKYILFGGGEGKLNVKRTRDA